MGSILSLPPRLAAAMTSSPGSRWAQKEAEAQGRTTGDAQMKMEEEGVYGLPARRPGSHAHFSSIYTSQRDLQENIGMAR